MTKQKNLRIDVAVGPELPFSQRFLDTLSEQLTQKGEQLLDLDLSQFLLVFLPEITVKIDRQGEQSEEKQAAPAFDKDNVAYCRADIVGPDNMGHSALVSWCCTAHPGERLRPDDPLAPSERHALEVRWAHLPLEALRARYLEPPPPYTIDAGEVSFQIQWMPWWQPPVKSMSYELVVTHNALEPTHLARIERKLWDEVTAHELTAEVLHRMQQQWNLSENEIDNLAKRGFANFWSGIMPREDGIYEIVVDFIVMNDDVVIQWLQALDNVAAELGLIRVRIRA